MHKIYHGLAIFTKPSSDDAPCEVRSLLVICAAEPAVALRVSVARARKDLPGRGWKVVKSYLAEIEPEQIEAAGYLRANTAMRAALLGQPHHN